MPGDLRKHTRSRAKKGAFAVFFRPNESHHLILGEIVDISEAGLGVCRIDVEERYTEPLEVSVYGLENEGFLDRMPCRIVYDMQVSDDPLEILGVRRCGIQFLDTSEELLDRLKQFIRKVGREADEADCS